MGWTKKMHGTVTIKPSEVMAMLSVAEVDMLMPKLRQAVDLAPGMVMSARVGLRRQIMLKETLAKNPNETDAGRALIKYFNLHYAADRTSEAKYWKCVRGIAGVYKDIYAGLMKPYTLIVSEIEVRGGAVFAVGPATTWKPVSPIRARFGFADEWGHVPWAQGSYGKAGDIELGYGYLANPKTSAIDLARTLVHEGSHKWAHTKDILYKSQSLAKTIEDDQDAEQLGQPMIPVAGRAKPFRPMTGLTASGDLIDAERYLENADSYAWAARRLWKAAMRKT